VGDLAQARSLALSLPEATEQDHHGMPSFRVRGKIYATVPDDEHIRSCWMSMKSRRGRRKPTGLRGAVLG